MIKNTDPRSHVIVINGCKMYFFKKNKELVLIKIRSRSPIQSLSAVTFLYRTSFTFTRK